jgi:uncharacterized protein (DUF2236 family)
MVNHDILQLPSQKWPQRWKNWQRYWDQVQNQHGKQNQGRTAIMQWWH